MENRNDGSAKPIKISDDTRFQSPLKFIISMMVIVALAFGGWVSLQNTLKNMSVKLEKVDRLEQTVADIRQQQILDGMVESYKSQNMWTVDMQLAYNNVLWSSLQRMNTDKPYVSSEQVGWPDVKRIQSAYPLPTAPKS